MEQAQKEQTYNQIAEQVIGKTAWGQYYALMRSAAALGEGSIPHRVCVSQDGTEIRVYNSTIGKVVGSFLKPTHEYVTKYLSRKEYGKALASTFGLFGQLTNIKEQQNANCFLIKPNDVISRSNQVAPRNITPQPQKVFGVEEDVFLIGAGTATVLALMFLIKAV